MVRDGQEEERWTKEGTWSRVLRSKRHGQRWSEMVKSQRGSQREDKWTDVSETAGDEDSWVEWWVPGEVIKERKGSQRY